MRFLYPGILAATLLVGYVVWVHMIRRRNLARLPFGSLIFLRPTPAVQTRKKRIEDLLLLAVRSLALVLLVGAFGRPFTTHGPEAQVPAGYGRRIVVLLDSSGSMRRANLWEQAVGHAKAVIQAARVQDRLCIITFDKATRTLLGLDQWAALAPDQRGPTALDLISGCRPTWSQTRMDQALYAALQAIEEDSQQDQSGLTSQVVLISDMQCPPEDLAAVQTLTWPKEVAVQIKQVRCEGPTNATMELVYGGPPGPFGGPAIRIYNSPGATNERFAVGWAGQDTGDLVQVYVPAGGSTTVPLPPSPEPPVGQIVLSGDDHDFDNSLFVAEERQARSVVFVGKTDLDNPDEMGFYLRRAMAACGVPFRALDRITSLGQQDLAGTSLLVIDLDVPDDPAELRAMSSWPGPCLAVATSGRSTQRLAGIAGIGHLESSQVDMGPSQAYAMITRIDPAHPALAQFKDPRYRNFTQIHVWRYWRFDPDQILGCRPLAWFDTNDLAMFEVQRKAGPLVVMTFPWHRPSSDLALSSKFVPLLHGLAGYHQDGQPSHYYVGQPISSPAQVQGPVVISRPDGIQVRLQPGEAFTSTDTPGIYTADSGQGRRYVAVNMDPREAMTWSDTVAHLGSLGMPIGQEASPAARPVRAGSADWRMLEARQKAWRWLLLACMVALLLEMAIAGYAQHRDKDI